MTAGTPQKLRLGKSHATKPSAAQFQEYNLWFNTQEENLHLLAYRELGLELTQSIY